MMKVTTLFFFTVLLISCKKVNLDSIVQGSITDNSGYTYNTVELGDQTWMAENLKTNTFSNGDTISEIKSAAEWNTNSSPAYCLYNNDVPNDAKYGKLYNYKAISSSKNICPTGWHVPSNKEWNELVDFVGGYKEAGTVLKQEGLTTWFAPNEEIATNESLFSAIPGGYRASTGEFYNEKFFAYYWTSDLDNNGDAVVKSLHYGSTAVGTISLKVTEGASVRCLKD